MKKEVSPTESKASTFQHSTAPAPRPRVSRTRDSPKLESPNGVALSPGLTARPKPSSPEVNNISRARRSLLFNKPKLGGNNMGASKERETEDSKIVDQGRIRTVEQFARVQRKGSEHETDGKVRDDLQRRLSVSETMVKELQSEVSALRAQLEKLQSLNVVLESQNKQFARDLSSAEARIKAFERHDQVEQISKEIHPSEFKDVRELIANNLELFPLRREVIKEVRTTKMQSSVLKPGDKSTEIHPRVLLVAPPPPPCRPATVTGPPPPPPPPPPHSVPLRANKMQKATALVEFYHSITKRDGKKGPLGNETCASPVASNAHNSIVGELQNRSAHLLAIKSDVEKRGDFINHLIQKIESAAFPNIEDVLNFVDWLDGQLSTLADERAVLKHFNWPERKADALREAAFEYRDLKRLLVEVSSFEDDTSVPCETTLKKIATLLDKSERSIQRLIKLRDTTMLSYKDCKIPIDWMLDSGMVSKIKLASMKLPKVYMKRVSTELELVQHLERESMQEALLFQGVRFAYRAYQFAEGLDSETMRAFEELREQVQLHRRGSRDLFHGITLP